MDGIRPERLLTAVGAWVGMVVVAIANAGFRETVVTPRAGEYPAHVISTGTLLVLLSEYVRAYFQRVRNHTVPELATIGGLWAGLTVAFELLFGHYIAGDSWKSLAAQYNVTQGRVWILVPLFLLVAPWLVDRDRSSQPELGKS